MHVHIKIHIFSIHNSTQRRFLENNWSSRAPEYFVAHIWPQTAVLRNCRPRWVAWQRSERRIQFVLVPTTAELDLEPPKSNGDIRSIPLGRNESLFLFRLRHPHSSQARATLPAKIVVYVLWLHPCFVQWKRLWLPRTVHLIQEIWRIRKFVVLVLRKNKKYLQFDSFDLNQALVFCLCAMRDTGALFAETRCSLSLNHGGWRTEDLGSSVHDWIYRTL